MYIKLNDCIKGHLYEIKSRNLGLGIFDGKKGFIGLREKFGNIFLFTEYHHDTGPPFGTVLPVKDLGKIPEHLELNERSKELFDYVVEKNKEIPIRDEEYFASREVIRKLTES